jgi:hypothetical protein
MIETDKEKKFWERVIVTKSCWIFFQANCCEYGHFGRISAHRFMWIHILGRAAPEGMELHHICENKRCVNPGHLEFLTISQHKRRHARFALKPSENKQMIDWVMSGEMSRAEAARHFSVSTAIIIRIVGSYLDSLIE